MHAFKVGDRVQYTYSGPCNQDYQERRRAGTLGTVMGLRELQPHHRRIPRYDVQWDDSPETNTWALLPESKLSLATTKEETMTRELIGKKPEPTLEPHVVFPVEAVSSEIRGATNKLVLNVTASGGPAVRRQIAKELADLLNEAFEARTKAQEEPEAPKHTLRKFVRKAPDYVGQSPAWEVEPGHTVIASTYEDAVRQWQQYGPDSYGTKDYSYGRSLNGDFFRVWKEDTEYKGTVEYKLRTAQDRDRDTWVERVPGVWHLVDSLRLAEAEYERGHEGTPSDKFGYKPLRVDGTVIPEHA